MEPTPNAPLVVVKQDYNGWILINKILHSRLVKWPVVILILLHFVRVKGWIDADTYQLITALLGALGVMGVSNTAKKDKQEYDAYAAK